MGRERFKDDATRDLWEGRSTKAARRAIPGNLHAKARLRLDFVYQAASMAAFTALPPGANFKELCGDLRGTYQFRIGGPYRIRFRWVRDRAWMIQAAHFHDEDRT
ncbi:MAG TPA: type II toxin-antitoxin system RelE/ParE family toxin [Candidatus Baltobacteraceae bacterium]|nr:type II toxin-antitoxin system RelE/ParE family toxin [Candidatus Baltobacteraceae bacterium]